MSDVKDVMTALGKCAELDGLIELGPRNGPPNCLQAEYPIIEEACSAVVGLTETDELNDLRPYVQRKREELG